MSSSHQDPVTSADAHELDASHDDAGPVGGAGPDLEAAEEDAQSPATPGHVDVASHDPSDAATHAGDAHDVDTHDVAAHAVGPAHDEHPAEAAAWVLAPLLVGAVIAVMLVLWLGFGSSG